MANTSNIAEVCAWLHEYADSSSFDRPGKDQPLGRDIAPTIIRGPDLGGQECILGRCAEATQPDGHPWPANSRGNAAREQKLYGWSEPNRRTGQMHSQQSLYGWTRIEPKQVTLVQGTGRARQDRLLRPVPSPTRTGPRRTHSRPARRTPGSAGSASSGRPMRRAGRMPRTSRPCVRRTSTTTSARRIRAGACNPEIKPTAPVTRRQLRWIPSSAD
jgi:hypothetical protein